MAWLKRRSPYRVCLWRTISSAEKARFEQTNYCGC
jgi:hypothetical protein